MRKNVSEDEWRSIKWAARISKNIRALAHRFSRSEATIMRVMASKTYEEFRKLVRAEHPPEGDMTLGKQFDRLLEVLCRRNLISEIDYIKRGSYDQGSVSRDQGAKATISSFHKNETRNPRNRGERR